MIVIKQVMIVLTMRENVFVYSVVYSISIKHVKNKSGFNNTRDYRFKSFSWLANSNNMASSKNFFKLTSSLNPYIWSISPFPAKSAYLSSTCFEHEITSKWFSFRSLERNDCHCLIQWISRYNLPVREYLMMRQNNRRILNGLILDIRFEGRPFRWWLREDRSQNQRNLSQADNHGQ